MHWILTIFLMSAQHPVVDHQEYYTLHNCQQAAALMKQQAQEGLGGYGAHVRFTCTQKDDNPLP
jgi:hypothetical protein